MAATYIVMHPANRIKQDAENRFVTDAQISAWNAKANSTHSHTKSQISDFPASLKNPKNIIIKLNNGTTEGTNLFTYDGSAAKTINITPSAIGAATSEHTHSYLPLSGGTLIGTLNTKDLHPTATGSNVIGSVEYAYSAANLNMLNIIDTDNNKVMGTFRFNTTDTSLSLHRYNSDKSATYISYLRPNTKLTAEVNISLPATSGTLALTKNIPASLPNPNSLTIMINGGTQGATSVTYNGTTATSIEITASRVGAATSDHGHESLNLNLGLTTGGPISVQSGRKPDIGSLSSPFYDAYIENKFNIVRDNNVYGMLWYDPTPKAACLQLGYKVSDSIINTYLYASKATKDCVIDLPASSGTLQVSSSDIRLKENIKDTNINALSLINNIKVRQFDWKDKDKGHQSIGFIVDELEELDSKLKMGGNSDELDENGLPMHPKCVDMFYLQGYEVKAIQELSAYIDSLKTEVNSLKEEIKQLKESR